MAPEEGPRTGERRHRAYAPRARGAGCRKGWAPAVSDREGTCRPLPKYPMPHTNTGDLGAMQVERNPSLRIVRSGDDMEPGAAVEPLLGRGPRRGPGMWVLGLATLPSLALIVVGGLLEAHGHVRTGGLAAVVGIVSSLASVGIHRVGRSAL